MTSVDVLVVAALQEEYDAARAVGSAHAAAGLAQWQEHDRDGSAPYKTIEITSTAGPTLSVALARPTRMGGRSTGPITTTLTERLNPQCLAMCGVCAGNPSVVALGDVVMAEMVYEYDEGKRTATDFLGDHRQFPMDERWVREAQEFSPAELPSYGRTTRQEATFWFLERLLAGDEPRTHPARARYFPNRSWRTWPAEMQTEGLIVWSGQGWALTDEGRSFVERRLYDDVDGPDRLPFAVKVAPMASGNVVVKDGVTWAQLSQMGVRTVAALEMEATTVATVARQQQVPHWLVVKGVMDHADPRKDDRYKTFAARASAEVLYALLTRLLAPTTTRQSASDSAGGLVTFRRGIIERPAGRSARTPLPASDLTDLTGEHRQTLQLISEMFRQHDLWPAFNLIDRPLRRHGIDAANAIMTMPVGLIAGRRGNVRPMRDDPIQLTIRGMALCHGAEHDVELFLAVTRWAAVLDDEFDPGNDPNAAPRLTSQGVAHKFRMDGVGSRDLRRLYAMLQVQRWGFSSGGGQPDNWWWEIDRDIQRFATVTTAEDYDEARAAWLAEPTQVTQAQENTTDRDPAKPTVRRATMVERLDQLAARDPVPDAASRVNGRLYLVVSPRTVPDDALSIICTQSATTELNAAVQRAIAVRVSNSSFAPDFDAGVWRRHSSGISNIAGVREDGPVREDSLLVLTVCEDGTITVLCGRATAQARPVWRALGAPEPESKRPVIFPSLLLGLVHSTLALAADLAQRHARYDGQWDIGLRVTGIKHAIAYEYVQNGDEDTVQPYDEDTYERTAVAVTTDLAGNAAATAERLIAPLLRALTIDALYLPYRKV